EVDDSNQLFCQYLTEIKNHIIEVKKGIVAAENDFRDLLNEEFKEENELSIQLDEKYNVLLNKQKELKQSSQEEANQINEEIQMLKSEITKLNEKHPIGGFHIPNYGGSDYLIDMDSPLIDTVDSAGMISNPLTRLPFENLKNKAKKGEL
ncbi:hypothetical protein ACFL55_02885, partial [Candidatus Latescibacterota bacterium]